MARRAVSGTSLYGFQSYTSRIQDLALHTIYKVQEQCPGMRTESSDDLFVFSYLPLKELGSQVLRRHVTGT
jgi:hypothetical protein